ncbi:MAG: hypothetical protein FWC97_06085 [Treponema sp.]|nr:hypothetical protein [Treponema sp.]
MKQFLFLLLIFFFAFSLAAQERPLNTGLTNDEQYSFVGLMLYELIELFGPPRSVAAARGDELWQDDVVFRYTGVDFYIFRDRVWQVNFTTTHGISTGDTKAAVLLVLGDTANAAEIGEDHINMPISGRNWPLNLRVNFNNTGHVSAIFLYRPDF